MSEIDKRREWFNSRTDKELDEITQWMDARHEVEKLEGEISKYLNRLQEAHKEIDRLKDEIETMKEYEKIVDGQNNG